MVADATQTLGIIPARAEDDEIDDLVANDACRAVRRPRVDSSKNAVGPGSSEKEAASLMHRMKPIKVEIGTIHYIKRAGFSDEQVEDVHIVEFAIGDVNECRNASAHVQ